MYYVVFYIFLKREFLQQPKFFSAPQKTNNKKRGRKVHAEFCDRIFAQILAP